MISFSELYNKAVEAPNRAVSATFSVENELINIEIGNWTTMEIVIHIRTQTSYEDVKTPTEENVKSIILERINRRVQCDNIPLLYPDILTCRTYYSDETTIKTIMWCKEVATNANIDNLTILTHTLNARLQRIELSYLKTYVLGRIHNLSTLYGCSITP